MTPDAERMRRFYIPKAAQSVMYVSVMIGKTGCADWWNALRTSTCSWSPFARTTPAMAAMQVIPKVMARMTAGRQQG